MGVLEGRRVARWAGGGDARVRGQHAEVFTRGAGGRDEAFVDFAQLDIYRVLSVCYSDTRYHLTKNQSKDMIPHRNINKLLINKLHTFCILYAYEHIHFMHKLHICMFIELCKPSNIHLRCTYVNDYSHLE